VTSTDGLLYFINFNTRQVEKIIQIHDGEISALHISPDSSFFVTASKTGTLRIWSTDFSLLKSEVNTGNEITSCDINYDST
jgi:WD40 repeat protein